MFEYHGNNLTVEADGVSITVALAEPLDIEKPLGSIDFTKATIVRAYQTVVEEADIKPEAAASLGWRFWKGVVDSISDDYGANGWMLAWVDSHYDINPGDASGEVLSRAIPYLELGLRGLMKFCFQESTDLQVWAEQVKERGQVIMSAQRDFIDEEAQKAAEELERMMPKRDPAIALKELRQFIQALGLERDAHNTSFWKEVEGKKLHLHHSSYDMGSQRISGGGWEGMNEGVRLSQEFLQDGKHNSNLGEVTVSERGYFAAGKKTGVDLAFGNSAGESKDFPTVEEALESLVPHILAGEEDWDWKL